MTSSTSYLLLGPVICKLSPSLVVFLVSLFPATCIYIVINILNYLKEQPYNYRFVIMKKSVLLYVTT